jgi:uncharacterized LabA/DUF88 family protein
VDSTPVAAAAQQSAKRAISFFDGQNLYYSAREAFRADYPNYHPVALTEHFCTERQWQCTGVRFYTGVPKLTDNRYWHNFWAAKKRFLSRDKRVYVFTRDMHYRQKEISFQYDAARIVMPDGFPLDPNTELLLPSGKTAPGNFWVSTAEEKGIDVRIALDIVRLTLHNEFDVCLIFSQDQDLSEAVAEVKDIAKTQSRFVELYSVFPSSNQSTNANPIRGTQAIPIDQATYESCLDPSNYSRQV